MATKGTRQTAFFFIEISLPFTDKFKANLFIIFYTNRLYLL